MQAATDVPVSKSTQVCLACKHRHRKCDWKGGTCSQCRDSGTQCIQQPTLKFRYHPKQEALSRASSLFRPCQLPPIPIRFYDETAALRAIYQDEQEDDHPFVVHSDSLSPQSADLHLSAADVATETTDNGFVAEDDFAYPEHAFKKLAPLTPTEALLLRNFITHMAQWTDIADPFRTFETEVCRLALTDPIIRYAICAFSARHFYRCQRGEDGDAEALDYQNRCLGLIIPFMSGGHTITASVLTAVALLRQNEEMDGQYAPGLFLLNSILATVNRYGTHMLPISLNASILVLRPASGT
jgi:hypothetical protein